MSCLGDYMAALHKQDLNAMSYSDCHGRHLTRSYRGIKRVPSLNSEEAEINAIVQLIGTKRLLEL